MNRFHYFVSFFHPEGSGMAEVSTSEEVKTFDDILELRDLISEHYEHYTTNDISIINYQLMRKDT